MNQKPLFRRHSIVFSICVMLVALSFGAFAQETKQNEAAEVSECKTDAAACEQIKKITERFKSGMYGRGGSYDFYVERAAMYLAIGELNAALSDINKCIKIVGSANDYVFRGNIYLRKGDYDDALEDFNAALKQRPTVSTAFLGRGRVYYQKKEYALALAALDRAIELNARLSQAYYYRSLIYAVDAANNNPENFEKSVQQAIKDFTSVIEIDLSKVDPKVYLKRAKLYEALGNETEAAIDRQKYEELTEKP